MRELKSLSLHCDGKTLKVLDQTLLPGEIKWIDATNPDVMVEAIHKLRVRGAPLIGIAAAICVALEAERGSSEERVRAVAQQLRASRPTAVNLMHCIDRMLSFAPGKMNVAWLGKTAEDIFNDDVKLCDAIANNGAKLIEDGDAILTHCNTGGLATAGVGTAIGIIRKAHESGKRISVWVDETRPLLQGGRLTTWEMGQLGIPYTLNCDNMAAILMRDKKVNKVIVGADRITANGDFANKVGTYSLAILAKHHGVPFYVAAPVTTLDTKLATGREITIENRVADEVRGVNGSFGKVVWSPADAKVFNPSFDVTPHDLVTGWILDTGVYDGKQIESGVLKTIS